MKPRDAREPTPKPDGTTAAILFGGLGALVIARAALVVPGTWIWSLQPLRFTPPVLGWGLMVLAALALVPAIARLQQPYLARLEAWIERAPRLSTLVGALAVTMAVAALPDRTCYVGDFLLRAGVLQSGRDIAVISPQSLPLDRLVHIDLPRALMRWGWAALPEQASRIVDAVEAGLFAWVALALGRELSGGRGLAFRFALALLGGAALGLFTGYAKAACDLCVLTALFVLGALRMTRGKGALTGSAALALALASHRSALLLVPAWLAVWFVAWRARRIAWRDPRTGIALLGPLAMLVVWGPHFVRILLAFDLSHHLAGPQVSGAGGPLAAAFAPIHLLDVANLAMAYAPMAPLALLLLARRGGGAPAGAEPVAPAIVVLALSALGMALLVHPQQGVYRDWDVFAIPGSVIAILTAWTVVSVLEQPAASRRASAPLIWGAVLSAGLWLGQAADTDRGLRRALAFVQEPPRRSGFERGKTWEFLGDRYASLTRWEEAATSLQQAVVDQPSPRLFRMLGIAEAQRGRWEASEAAIYEAARRDPSDTTTWAVLITTATTRGDTAMARLAATELRRISPHHPLAEETLGSP